MFNKEEATKTINLVKVLNVAKVFYIDDQLEDISSIDKIIEALTSDISEEKKSGVNAMLPGVEFESPPEVFNASIREEWNKLTDEKKNYLTQQLESLLETSLQKDDDIASFISETFRTEIPVVAVGPTQWERMQSHVISEASLDKRVFCLFDQDLSKAENFSETGSKSGIGLIRKLTTDDDKKGVVLCAIFSGALTKDQELEKWKELTRDQNLPSSSFFPLSKERIQSSEDFKKGVQQSSLNGIYDIVKRSTYNIIEEASKKTIKELDELPLYDFQHMVVTSSAPQGIWEAATLLRVYGIIQEDNIKHRMVIDKYAESFNEAIKLAEQINVIGGKNKIEDYTIRIELRHKELYESSESINSSYSPLIIGDIFRNEAEKGQENDFILIAQPCDLTVRGNSGERRSKIVHLAPIKQLELTKYEEMKKDPKKVNELANTYPLYYYKSNTKVVGLVELSKTFAINVNILDLAVLNPEGKCHLDVSKTLECPLQLYKAWQKRFSIIVTEFKEYHESVQKLVSFVATLDNGPEKEKILTSALPISTLQLYKEKIVLPENPYNDGFFDYKLQRVNRLRSPYSTYLLEQYTNYFSRAAFDHDFAQ